MVRDIYRQRKVMKKFPKEFILLLECVTHEDIAWVTHWWRLRTTITQTYNQGGVVMVGLKKASYYYPGHFKR